jgi:hypothetical protein
MRLYAINAIWVRTAAAHAALIQVKKAPYLAANDGYLESKKRSKLFSINHIE